MKLLSSLSAAALLCAAPVLASAQQAQTIAYGRGTVTFANSFQQTLSGLGAAITDYEARPLTNGVIVLQATAGVVDLNTAVSEFSTKGGYIISAGGASIRIQNLTFDLTNPSAPVVTGIFSINNQTIGRMPVFTMQTPAGLALPLAPQNGVEQINGFNLTLAPAAANTINGLFGAQVLPAGTAIGSADLYAVLATSGTL